MRKRYDEGGEVDAMEAVNKSDEAMDIASSVGAGERNTETVKATPKKAAAKPAVKPTVKAESKPAPKAAPVDETKLSLSDRMKLSRDRARSGSTTDTRSVSQRIREKFGMKKGGAVKKMASGGSTSSASKRADGIASRGKTSCKMY